MPARWLVRILWAGAALVAARFAVLAASQPFADCGTGAGRLQQEMFLHQRHVAERAKTRAIAAASPLQQDVGQIAVIDDSGGVIGRRNPFNLDHRTVVLEPAPAGYSIKLGGDTYDAGAVAQGRMLTLADDDSQKIALPFPVSFFGAEYRELFVNSNGTLTFGAADPGFDGSSYGHFLAGPPSIAACFTDLDPSQSSQGVRVLIEAGRVVVSWDAVPLAGSTSAAGRLQTVQPHPYLIRRIAVRFSA